MENIRLQTAIACIACDGSFDDRELRVLENVAERENLCPPDELARAVADFKTRLADEGLRTLRGTVDRLMAAALDRPAAESILKTAHAVILADSRIEYLEIKFFKLLCRVLHVALSSLPALIPGIEQIFCDEDIAAVSPVDDYFIAADLASQNPAGA